jgi:cytochrome c biogenesis protein CcdA
MFAEVPLLLAFASGSVSTVNPCGFAMLPAFISYFLGEREGAGVTVGARLLRAFAVAGMVTAGFVLVFGLMGALITVGSESIVRVIPWIALGVGVVLIAVGAAILAGRTFSFGLHPVRQIEGRGGRTMVVYGIGYGLASVGCTLPVFLVVVAGALSATGFLSGLVVFLAYALGMGVVLLGVTVATALGKTVIIGWFRRAVPYVELASGVGLLTAGAYLVYREIAFLRFTGSI